MRLLRQLLISLIILLLGLAAVIRFLPAARDMAAGFGVPEGLLALVAPAPPLSIGQDGARQHMRGGPAGPALVVTKAVTLGKVNDRLNAIGDGDALQSVTVTPSVNGVLSTVAVKSGDRVKQGDVIARLDDESETLALEKARVALASAEQILARNRDLKAIVSRAELDKAESDAATQRLLLAEAELALRQRAIRAPISGIAGIVSVSPGDYVTTSSAIVTIDDRSELIVDFWVPERFAAMVKVGDRVEARAIARPGDLRQGVLSAIDSRIDQASRTLRLQARIANAEDQLRAGMSFAVSMQFAGETFPAVDPLSIQWDSQGAFVWRIREEKAERVNVHIIERNAENVLVQAELQPGDAIVTEGVQRLRPGGKVIEAGENSTQKPADKPRDKVVEAKP